MVTWRYLLVVRPPTCLRSIHRVSVRPPTAYAVHSSYVFIYLTTAYSVFVCCRSITSLWLLRLTSSGELQKLSAGWRKTSWIIWECNGLDLSQSIKDTTERWRRGRNSSPESSVLHPVRGFQFPRPVYVSSAVQLDDQRSIRAVSQPRNITVNHGRWRVTSSAFGRCVILYSGLCIGVCYNVSA